MFTLSKRNERGYKGSHSITTDSKILLVNLKLVKYNDKLMNEE